MKILSRFILPCLFALASFSVSAADLGLPGTYRCGEHTVSISADADQARLRLGGRWLTFMPALSASGAKYELEGAPDSWVWNKGADYFINLPETGEVACTAVLPAPQVFSAGGNEPGWRLDLDEKGAMLTFLDATPISAPLNADPEPTSDGRRVRFGAASASIADSLCRDSATGMPHPYTVGVETADATFTGCGGAPLALLAGVTWKVASLAGQPIPDGVVPTLLFDENGTVSGFSGCNRFTGSFQLTGEGLTFGLLAMTRMACPETQMNTEQALSAVLDSTTRFDMSETGTLLLVSNDTNVLEAKP